MEMWHNLYSHKNISCVQTFMLLTAMMWQVTVTVRGKVNFKSPVVEKLLGTPPGEALNLKNKDYHRNHSPVLMICVRRLNSWLKLFSALSEVSGGVRAASWCTLGQWSTQVPPHICGAHPQSETKTIIQSLVNGAGLKIIVLKPVNDGFLGFAACVIARGMYFQLVPWNYQKSSK